MSFLIPKAAKLIFWTLRIDTASARPSQSRPSINVPEPFETPGPKHVPMDIGGSAMKGVILADGQAVPTPAATQLRQLLTESPSKRVDLFHVLDTNPPAPTFKGTF